MGNLHSSTLLDSVLGQNQAQQQTLKQKSKRKNGKKVQVEIQSSGEAGMLFDIVITDKHLTCGWLISEVIRRYKEQSDSNTLKIVQLITKSNNEVLDYWLSKWERSLLPFHDGDVLKAVFCNNDISEKGEMDHPSIQDFELIKCIGQGGFSRVYLVRRKDTGLLYAMKTVKKNFVLKQKKAQQIMQERLILEKLNHPFLIKMKWAFQSQKELYFVLDFCPGGELFFHLRKIGRLTEDQAKFYFLEILLGIEEIHKNNIVYRDLKPENVLLDLDGHVRLTDFGLSKGNIQIHSKTFSFCGSPEYMSPEMLQGLGHGRMIDFYSLGVILYEMLVGVPPFYDQDKQKMQYKIENEEIQTPNDLSNEVKSLLNGLLNKIPQQRIGALRGVDEIKFHP